MKKICLLLITVISVLTLTGCFENNSSEKESKDAFGTLVDNKILPNDLKEIDKVNYYRYVGEHGSNTYYTVYESKDGKLYMLDYRTHKKDGKTTYDVTIYKNITLRNDIEIFYDDSAIDNPEDGIYTYSDKKVSRENKYDTEEYDEYTIEDKKVTKTN